LQLIIQVFADQLQIPFLEASAKEGDNVEEVFVTMASEVKNRATILRLKFLMHIV